MANFDQLGLCSELIFSLEQQGYTRATAIQAEAIPAVLEGRDIIAQAQTGTGKTASFALPMIERLKPNDNTDYYPIRGLVLCPTRELAIQVAEKTLSYGEHLGMRVISIYGGVRFDNQLRKMKRGADILVATPGRLLEMLLQKKISLSELQMLVFDEADRMLDLGFIHDIDKILSFAPKQRQTLLFSATYTQSVEHWAQRVLNNPQKISVAPSNSTAKNIQQSAYKIDHGQKQALLNELVQQGDWRQTIIFTRTKRRADNVANSLSEAGFDAKSIHGDKLQKERSAILSAFSQGSLNLLVATDVAARGLDIEALPRVVNFDIPNQPEAYVHRIGRTARAGKSGQAISFVAPDEREFLMLIEQLIAKRIQFHKLPPLFDGHKTQSNKSRTSGKKKKTANKPTYRAPALEQPQKPALRRSLIQKTK
ncbi:MAG: DEAD/DEAH box helicase [Pseudomonadales bacterium]